MSDDRPTRRDLMKPVQLLGLAFAAALFAGIVTLVSMGFFQQGGSEKVRAAVVLALIIAGVTFIVVLLVVSLLLLAIDPAQVTKTIDKPVLLPDEDDETDAAASVDPKA
ncbi:amino acid transporter [Microbacterium sp. CFBP9034]|uniref:amino acid transporter n=1 Tax=Microbacterium sp. CFBP9034 TaxID=3096540 RepID=UPI002A6A2465|nr:amino acid transporter [Microbacterium sp. CFBP9034]MDY0908143.1 amino acid transporter [Microbacterium sp. CFBP9034]